MADSFPVPDPSGALQPPNRLPPTAVGTAMVPPEEPARSRAARASGLSGGLRRALTRMLEASDDLAARIRRRIIGR